MLVQVIHIHYLTFGKNANFSVQYQLHSFLGIPHNYMKKCSACALPCHTPLIAHQDPHSCRVLPSVISCPKGIAQPLLTAPCCKQQQDTQQSCRWRYKVPSRTLSDSKSGSTGLTPGTENWSLSQILRPAEPCPTLFNECFHLLSSETKSSFISFYTKYLLLLRQPQYFKTSSLFSRRLLTHSSLYT